MEGNKPKEHDTQDKDDNNNCNNEPRAAIREFWLGRLLVRSLLIRGEEGTQLAKQGRQR